MPHYIEQKIDFQSKQMAVKPVSGVIGPFSTHLEARKVMVQISNTLFRCFGTGQDPMIQGAQYVTKKNKDNNMYRRQEFVTMDGLKNTIELEIFHSDRLMPTELAADYEVINHE